MKVPLATRLDDGLRQRLRIYAALNRRTVEDVVSSALDGYLPLTSEMVCGGGKADQGSPLAEQPGVA